jgi:hypothetical protein
MNGSVLAGTPVAPAAAPAQATTTAAQSTTQSVPAPVPASSANAPWYEQPDYTETAAWAKSRGYKFDAENLVGEALRGHHNAEKLIGLDRAGRTLVVPKEDSPKEEWDAYYNKLGRPSQPTEYKLPTELKDDPVAKAFAEAAHEKGFNQKQFESTLDFVSKQAAAIEAQQAQESEVKAIQAIESLRGEWGGEFELRAEASRRAVRELGLQAEEALSIEKALGVDRAAKVFFEIGKKLLDPTTEGLTGGGQSSFGMSKTEAQGRIGALMKDPEFGKKLASGDSSAKMEWDKLNAAAYG